MARVIASAASGTLRDDHSVLTSDGIYERSTLIEKASTNLAVQSENFGTTWTANGTPTRVAAAHTASGVTLDLIGDDDAAALEYYALSVTFTGDADKAVSVFAKMGTSPAAGWDVVLRDTSGGGADRLAATVTWSAAGVPSASTTDGAYLGSIALADGVYRLLFTAIGVVAANANAIQIYPTRRSTLADVGNVYVGGVQCEDSVVPTSYVKTTTVAVTRNADVLSYPFTTVPQSMSVYVKFIENGTSEVTDGRVVQIGAGDNSGPRFIILNGTTGYKCFYQQTAGGVDSDPQATSYPSYGDTVEILATLTDAGLPSITQVINGTAAAAVAGTGLGIATAWSDDVIWLNSVNGTGSGAAAFLSVKVAKGVKTLAEMRALHDAATNALVLNAGDDDAIFVQVASVNENEATDIGGMERAFAGNLRVGTRDQKRQWNVTTHFMEEEDRQAILTLTADNAPIPCSGILLFNETVSCSVKVTGASMIRGTPLWVLNLRLMEV